MEGPSAVLNVITIPPGATKTQPRIVLDGVRGAIFVYGTGGALIGSWARSAGTDPYANAYPQGLKVAIGEIDAPNQIENSAGTFAYSGTPAAGNLIYSRAVVTGATAADQFGNNYIDGTVFYDNTHHLALQITSIGLALTWLTFTAQPGAAFTLLDASVAETSQGAGSTGIQVGDFLEIITTVIPSGMVLAPVLFAAAAGNLQYLSAFDNAAYLTGYQEQASSTSVTLTTSPQAVATIAAVGAGRYHVTGWVNFIGGAGGGTVTFGFDGTATVSHADWQVTGHQSGSTALILPQNFNGGASITQFTTPVLSNGIGYAMRFDLTVTFSAAGTFSLRGQVSAANTATNTAAFLRAELAP